MRPWAAPLATVLTLASVPRDARADDASPRPATGFLFDLSAGLTKADLGDVPVAFDGHAGWVGRRLAFEVFAARSFTETRPPGRIDTSVRRSYGAAARVFVGDEADRFRAEARVEHGYADWKDGWRSLANDSRDYENVDVTQSSILLGVRYRSPVHFARLSLGAGLVRDSYHHFAYDPTGKSLRDETDTRSGLREVARLYTRSIVLPEKLSVRVVVDAATFELRRVQFNRRGDAVPVDTDWTTTDSRETFVRARVFADLDLLGFAGLVPGVFAGVDHLASEASPERSGTTPVVGLAIVQAGVLE